MRVVGGRLKGRNLASPSSRDIRPTADRLRESVFNILVHAYDDPIEGARVLDLFAGTGALGIEASSRGAKCAMSRSSSSHQECLVDVLAPLSYCTRHVLSFPSTLFVKTWRTGDFFFPVVRPDGCVVGTSSTIQRVPSRTRGTPPCSILW